MSSSWSELRKGSQKQDALLLLGSGVAHRSKGIAYIDLPGIVVDGETLTIGADVWEFENLDTDSTLNTTNLDNTTNPVTETIVAHGLVAGQYIAVENEIMLITAVPSVDTFTVNRGQAGTTNASHVDGSAVMVGDGVTAGNYVIPLDDAVTAAEASNRIPGVINDNVGGADSDNVRGVRISDAMVVLVDETGAAPTLAEATTNCTLRQFAGGKDHNVPVVTVQQRVPTAAEVTDGIMYFACDFTPAHAQVLVNTTSSWDVVVWDGAFDADQTNDWVSINNAGATDWAATDKTWVTVIIWGSSVDLSEASVSA